MSDLALLFAAVPYSSSLTEVPSLSRTWWRLHVIDLSRKNSSRICGTGRYGCPIDALLQVQWRQLLLFQWRKMEEYTETTPTANPSDYTGVWSTGMAAVVEPIDLFCHFLPADDSLARDILVIDAGGVSFDLIITSDNTLNFKKLHCCRYAVAGLYLPACRFSSFKALHQFGRLPMKRWRLSRGADGAHGRIPIRLSCRSLLKIGMKFQVTCGYEA